MAFGYFAKNKTSTVTKGINTDIPTTNAGGEAVHTKPITNKMGGCVAEAKYKDEDEDDSAAQIGLRGGEARGSGIGGSAFCTVM